MIRKSFSDLKKNDPIPITLPNSNESLLDDGEEEIGKGGNYAAVFQFRDSNQRGTTAAQEELRPSKIGRYCGDGNAFNKTELVPLKSAKKEANPAME
jgi:hypothetical protein